MKSLRHTGGARRALASVWVGALAAMAIATAGENAAVAGAAVPDPGSFVVRAIGDSVTAGFGYCGVADPACTGGYLNPATALLPCVRASYLDACSANVGAYPSVGDVLVPPPALPAAPVSWADQFALREGMSNYVNAAVTGSTPQQWSRGDLRGRLGQVVDAHPNLTLMTLGANPVLHGFYTRFKNVACLFSLNPFESEATLLRRVHGCALKELEAAGSRAALAAVYERLLGDRGNHLLVLLYHTPWPVAFPLRRYVRKNEVAEIIRTINDQIASVTAAIARRYPGRLSIVATPPWGENHQCLAEPPSERWVIDLDFCIHPSRAGYAQMTGEVVRFARAHPRELGFAGSDWVS